MDDAPTRNTAGGVRGAERGPGRTTRVDDAYMWRGHQPVPLTDGLGRLLYATLEAADLHVLAALHSWLDSRRGIGTVGMGVLRRSSDEPTVMPSRGGMTLNLVTYHKALSPTRRARNNSDRILLSTVFIGTPAPSVLSLRRKRIPNTVNPPRRGRSYPVRDVRFKTVQGQPGSQISGPMLAALRSFLVAGPWCHRTRYVR